MNDDERVRDERAEKEFETEIALIQLRCVLAQVLLRLGVVERKLDELAGKGELPY